MHGYAGICLWRRSLPAIVKKTAGDLSMHDLLAPGVFNLLEGWLKLPAAGAITFGAQAICSALFGEAWWDLRRPDEAGARSVAEVVRVERPLFVTGLVPWLAAESLPLPLDIGMAC